MFLEHTPLALGPLVVPLVLLVLLVLRGQPVAHFARRALTQLLQEVELVNSVRMAPSTNKVGQPNANRALLAQLTMN